MNDVHDALTLPDRDGVVSRMLSALAEVFGEPMTLVRLEGYLLALSDIPVDDLRLGVRRVMKNARFFPKPAELRTAVDVALTVERHLAPQVDDFDARVLEHCQHCHDVGWVFLPDQPGRGPTVTKCFCFSDNPALRRRTRYGRSDDECR